MHDKLLTIIVPCYNMEKYIDKCLDSLGISELREVALPNGMSAADCLEVVVVNDGSTDRTSDFARAYSQKIDAVGHPSVIRVIDKENGHYGSCINVGLSVACSVYIKILEPDDTYHTKNFANFMQYVSWCDSQGVDVILSELEQVDKNGVAFSSARHTLEQSKVYPISELTNTKGCVFNGGLTYRTELLRSIGYHQMEGVCYSDTQWYLIPLCHAKTLACFPHVLYRYFVGRDGQSMSRKQYARNTWMMEKVAMDLLDAYDENVKHAASCIARHYRRMIYECLLSIYVACIIWKEKKYSRTDLRELDERVRNAAPDIFEKIGTAEWSNSVLPYRYVTAWRRHSPLLPLMAWICRQYSAITMFVSRCRHR